MREQAGSLSLIDEEMRKQVGYMSLPGEEMSL